MATILIAPSSGDLFLHAGGRDILRTEVIWFTTHIKFVRYFSEQGSTGGVAGAELENDSYASRTPSPH
ncbi:hypothetical protein C8Q70DRAFT_1053295 [Cubamyces menziesii]|nr:hypothetical protein C8Q70DRAFT_1053295 [Cubamyces menziesii]